VYPPKRPRRAVSYKRWWAIDAKADQSELKWAGTHVRSGDIPVAGSGACGGHRHRASTAGDRSARSLDRKRRRLQRHRRSFEITAVRRKCHRRNMKYSLPGLSPYTSRTPPYRIQVLPYTCGAAPYIPSGSPYTRGAGSNGRDHVQQSFGVRHTVTGRRHTPGNFCHAPAACRHTVRNLRHTTSTRRHTAQNRRRTPFIRRYTIMCLYHAPAVTPQRFRTASEQRGEKPKPI
jgi:hypothetical protein